MNNNTPERTPERKEQSKKYNNELADSIQRDLDKKNREAYEQINRQ